MVIIGSTALRECLHIDVMVPFNERACAAGAANAPDPAAGTRIEVLSSEAQAEATLPEQPDRFRETLVFRGPDIFVEGGAEVAARREALIGALGAAMEARLPGQHLTELEEIVLRQNFGVVRRALTGEPPGCVEPIRRTLHHGADLS